MWQESSALNPYFMHISRKRDVTGVFSYGFIAYQSATIHDIAGCLKILALAKPTHSKCGQYSILYANKHKQLQMLSLPQNPNIFTEAFIASGAALSYQKSVADYKNKEQNSCFISRWCFQLLYKHSQEQDCQNYWRQFPDRKVVPVSLKILSVLQCDSQTWKQLTWNKSPGLISLPAFLQNGWQSAILSSRFSIETVQQLDVQFR